MSTTYLKVKIKSLAEEARIIRKEEHKAKASYRYHKDRQGHEEQYQEALDTFWGLRFHRKGDVGSEARASHLAYAFIRGKSYFVTENSEDLINWSHGASGINHSLYYKNLLTRIARLATKYGPEGEVTEKQILEWIQTEGIVLCDKAA